jgi:monothiol glutaredoxin
MRKVLSNTHIQDMAMQSMLDFHPQIISEIETTIKNNEWVIVGMKQNPVVSGARKYLNHKNISYEYIEHGSYFSMWKERLAIKLWSGWPTFPQVFHKGSLVGGFSELKKYKDSHDK